MRDRVVAAAVSAGLLLLAGCGADAQPQPSDVGGSGRPSAPPTASARTAPPRTAPPESIAIPTRFPAITKVEVSRDRRGYGFAVTISSPYDSSRRYADAFRVRSHGGEVFGIRELAHPHSEVQPFTRALDDVQVPESVGEVVVEGRDSVNGWGGKTRVVRLPG